MLEKNMQNVIETGFGDEPRPTGIFKFAFKIKISKKEEHSAIPDSLTERAMFLFC